MILRPLGRSFLCLAMLRHCKGKGQIEGITCNEGLGTSQKTVYQHKFVVLYIVSCRVAIKSNNFKFLLPFLAAVGGHMT